MPYKDRAQISSRRRKSLSFSRLSISRCNTYSATVYSHLIDLSPPTILIWQLSERPLIAKVTTLPYLLTSSDTSADSLVLKCAILFSQLFTLYLVNGLIRHKFYLNGLFGNVKVILMTAKSILALTFSISGMLSTKKTNFSLKLRNITKLFFRDPKHIFTF